MSLRKKRREGEVDPFYDMLFNILIAFVFCFIIALLAMKQACSKHPASHLRRHPPRICAGSAHICAWTGLRPSKICCCPILHWVRVGSPSHIGNWAQPNPHLRRDWAYRCEDRGIRLLLCGGDEAGRQQRRTSAS